MAENMPADWAFTRMRDLRGVEPYLNPVEVAFARYIEAHEEPPTDPLLIEAREICASVRKTHGEGFLSGKYDDSSTEIPVAMAALRRGIEIERERSNG